MGTKKKKSFLHNHNCIRSYFWNAALLRHPREAFYIVQNRILLQVVQSHTKVPLLYGMIALHIISSKYLVRMSLNTGLGEFIGFIRYFHALNFPKQELNYTEYKLFFILCKCFLNSVLYELYWVKTLINIIPLLFRTKTYQTSHLLANFEQIFGHLLTGNSYTKYIGHLSILIISFLRAQGPSKNISTEQYLCLKLYSWKLAMYSITPNWKPRVFGNSLYQIFKLHYSPTHEWWILMQQYAWNVIHVTVHGNQCNSIYIIFLQEGLAKLSVLPRQLHTFIYSTLDISWTLVLSAGGVVLYAYWKYFMSCRY